MKTITKSKKQVSSCDIREGYYQLSDGEINLADAIQNDPATKDDPKLKEAIKMLRDAQKALDAALAPYAWD